MSAKINNQNFQFSKILIWLLVIGLLVYSRFINLGWGLPYPMHPDERNMAVAIEQLSCKLPDIKLDLPKSLMGEWKPFTTWLKVSGQFNVEECLNPHFFAYGQFPLYLGSLLVFLFKLTPMLALRIISAIASILNVFVLIKIIQTFYPISSKVKDQISNPSSNLKTFSFTLDFALCTLIFTFVPYAIQFAHFGTTESLLMLFYSLIVYLTVLLIERRANVLSYVFETSFILGLAVGTKVSSVIFMSIPLMALIFMKNKKFPVFYFLASKLFDLFIFFVLTFLFFVLFSPHNFINFKEFLGSMNYESDVALGKYVVFYTRQFVDTVPVLFQATNVFPYAMGWGVGLMGLIGLMGIGWRDRKINLLRLAFFAYFLPSAFLFAKWTRFMTPVFPILTIFGILFLQSVILRFNRRIKIPAFVGMTIIGVIIFILILPGIKYLSVYQNPDVRFQATEWINKNIPENSYVLSETANVVDIPLESKNNLNVISFNFYDLDESPQLQEELRDHLEKADYIFVPSRRVFANLNGKYPILSKYYEDLFSGQLGFEKVAEFTAGLDDEQAEETWTVFDHPTIRIYKKVKS